MDKVNLLLLGHTHIEDKINNYYRVRKEESKRDASPSYSYLRPRYSDCKNESTTSNKRHAKNHNTLAEARLDTILTSFTSETRAPFRNFHDYIIHIQRTGIATEHRRWPQSNGNRTRQSCYSKFLDQGPLQHHALSPD